MLKIFTCHGAETLLELSTFIDKLCGYFNQGSLWIQFSLSSLLDELIGRWESSHHTFIPATSKKVRIH